jgi:hypothetical protein
MKSVKALWKVLDKTFNVGIAAMKKFINGKFLDSRWLT